MSDADVLEVVVYGDAPEGTGGGGTDVISIPADFYSYYEPLGPVIVNPPVPPPGGGGGGGDVDNPKEALEDAEEGAYWSAVGFAIIALTPGAREITIGGVTLTSLAGAGGILAGVTGHQLGEAAEDPPQPNYARSAHAAPRTTTLTPEQTAVSVLTCSGPTLSGLCSSDLAPLSG